MSRPPRRPAWQKTTLLVSLALTAMLGSTLYFATSSLPFLASSPTSDPVFGALNACLHHAVPSRTGFTVSRDARQAAVWSTNTVARCALGTDETREKTWSIPGVTVGAFDGAGGLWVVSQPGGLTSTLLAVTDQGATPHGETGAQGLAGTATGLVVLEQDGRLVALSSSGEGTGVAELPPSRGLRLAVSADGTRVAVTGDGALRIYEAARLTPIRLEVPCDVASFWWLREGPRALIECGADRFALVLDVDRGGQDAATPRVRSPSLLAGPDGPFVEPCDVLPCTATDPLGPPR
ncbi:MAG: hypothetical protein Q8N26_27775 [Myxococcales bacterium]|nr:hypothetical protein [Myxococcales bacterium]